MTEHDIQCAFVELMRTAAPKVIVKSTPNEGPGRASQGRAKARGMVAGWPDIEVLWGARPLYIEFKTPKGALTESQRTVHAMLRDLRYTVLVCRSAEQAIRLCEVHGVPMTRVLRDGHLVLRERAKLEPVG